MDNCHNTSEKPSKDAKADEPRGRKGYRRKRTFFSQDQLTRMEQAFQINKYPGIGLREALARELDICEGRIQVWFQNRRSKWRKHQNNSSLAGKHPVWFKPKDSHIFQQTWPPCPTYYGPGFGNLKSTAHAQHGLWEVPTTLTSTACTSLVNNKAPLVVKTEYEAQPSQLTACMSSILSTEGYNYNQRGNVHLDQPIETSSPVPCGQTYRGAQRSSDEILAAKGLVSVREVGVVPFR